MSLLKLHKIATYIAVWSVSLTVVLFFLAETERMLRLNVLPQALELVALLVGFVMGSIAVASVTISVVLSLYRLATKE